MNGKFIFFLFVFLVSCGIILVRKNQLIQLRFQDFEEKMNKNDELSIVNFIIQNPDTPTSDIINNVNIDDNLDINKLYEDIEILKRTPIVLLISLRNAIQKNKESR